MAGDNGRVHPVDDQQRLIGGRYRLSVQLGSGAMGTVWSGYDEVLRRRVAVKELKVPPGVPQREAMAMRERMLREARALGGLSHPNVITVYDVVDAGGEPMVVLEMVPSRNLATLISEQGVLSTAQAAVVGFATSAALRAAHRAGITHRDVKPGNVLVAHDGQVKLTDFGIARNVADAPMTTAGLVLGSPAYIAPEVAAGQPVTPAADLWGLGATLFAAVEGRPPYDVRGDPVSTITEVVDGEVPRPSAGGPVADVIAALMVKEPAKRMSLGEVRRRLRPLIGDPDDPLYPGSPDAPTMAATYRVPQGSRAGGGPASSGGSGPAGRRSAPPVTPPPGVPAAPVDVVGARPRRRAGPAAPLAASPGPLPRRCGRPLRPCPAAPRDVAGRRADRDPAAPRRTRPPAARTSGRTAAGLVAAGAAVVLAGLLGGWAVDPGGLGAVAADHRDGGDGRRRAARAHRRPGLHRAGAAGLVRAPRRPVGQLRQPGRQRGADGGPRRLRRGGHVRDHRRRARHRRPATRPAAGPGRRRDAGRLPDVGRRRAPDGLAAGAAGPRRRARRAADGARAATPRASRRSCSTSWPTRSPRRADRHEPVTAPWIAALRRCGADPPGHAPGCRA